MLIVDLEKIKDREGTTFSLFRPSDFPEDFRREFRFGEIGLQWEILRKSEIELEFRGLQTWKMDLICSRCLNPYSRDKTFRSRLTLLPAEEMPDDEEERELEEGDMDIYYYENYNLDLLPLIREGVVLSVPMKTLCSDDCKGLCPVCGINLNNDNCSCEQHDIDPRLEKLLEIKKQMTKG